jgi:hypothetical protein
MFQAPTSIFLSGPTVGLFAFIIVPRNFLCAKEREGAQTEGGGEE